MLTQVEQEICRTRPKMIDYDRLPGLHYLGNYVRRLPVNMARMMENAHDWEHLPHVHATSFRSIALIAQGRWGWRAKVELPEAAGGGDQLIDLLVDNDRNYWATTVLSGTGTGVEIHTQASTPSDVEIEVDVRFYLPEALPDKAVSDFVLSHLQTQYKTLYDEDLGLMSGRQTALNHRQAWRSGADLSWPVKVGTVEALDRSQIHLIDVPGGRVCLRWHKGAWISHSATCPHLLGPLQESSIDASGAITCPWHGYRFDAASGTNLDGKCGALSSVACLAEHDGVLWLEQAS